MHRVQQELRNQTYRLRFFDAGKDLQREVEFDANCDYRALALAQEIAACRTAQLWRDGAPVCRLRRIATGGFRILPMGEPDEW